MKKLGIILTAYGLEEFVEPCLNPWKTFDVHFSCVSFQFEGFDAQDNKKCINELKKFLPSQSIFYDEKKILKEHDARNIGLNYLKNDTEIDTFLILDIDEIYTEKDIENLLYFIDGEDFNWVAWAKINFKNYIFDGKSWIDNFCPPRIFKRTHQMLDLENFYWDNDITYKDINGKSIDYKQLANITVPKNKLHIKHLTWLNTERSKNKIKYQEKHFGLCSYQWNDLQKCVEINQDFYKKSGQIPPTIYNDIYA